nr:hypothetical protein [Lysinibacillus timonensis]
MKNKLYYAIITALIIIGFIFPVSQSFLLAVLFFVASYFLWKKYKERLKHAEGEEEITRSVVALILLTFLVVIYISTIIF